jgi:hypothetical protein
MKERSHYLSWMSQNEFLSLCGDKLLKFILEELEEGIYYSMIADATPIVLHGDQKVLILIYMYVTENSEN